MNERRHDEILARSIDRLAAGDLDAPARRELFAWLDAEPLRWRRCALALLEARDLEQALDDWIDESRSEAKLSSRRLQRSQAEGLGILRDVAKNIFESARPPGSTRRAWAQGFVLAAS